jgi:hypothetical protein
MVVRRSSRCSTRRPSRQTRLDARRRTFQFKTEACGDPAGLAYGRAGGEENENLPAISKREKVKIVEPPRR